MTSIKTFSETTKYNLVRRAADKVRGYPARLQYMFTRKNRNGEYQHEGHYEFNMREGHYEFNMREVKDTVSWKRYCPNKATSNIHFRHWNPSADHLDVTADEWYTSDKGRVVSRESMHSLNMEQVKAMRDYLTNVLENHEKAKGVQA